MVKAFSDAFLLGSNSKLLCLATISRGFATVEWIVPFKMQFRETANVAVQPILTIQFILDCAFLACMCIAIAIHVQCCYYEDEVVRNFGA